MSDGGRERSDGGRERYERLRREHRWEVPERYNIAADVCDRRAPDALAMVHESHDGAVRECTWGELQALSNRAANLLGAMGVERGDRVAVVLPPTPETAAVFFGMGSVMNGSAVDAVAGFNANRSAPELLC